MGFQVFLSQLEPLVCCYVKIKQREQPDERERGEKRRY